MRLDQKIAELNPQLSRSFAAKMILEGKVTLNGVVVTKTSHKVSEGDRVKLNVDIDAFKTVPDIELPILYEDDDCIVINKPIGVLTHSKGAFNPEATVASYIKGKINFPENDEPNDRSGIVHRLDRATSGVIICAKNPASLVWLQKQFSERKAKKTYLAIVEGRLNPKEAIIDMPIARNPKNPKTFYVSPSGKRAVTHYRVKEELGNGQTLVVLKPETGRTHQLRVHMSYLKHPIVGDSFYEGSTYPRMLLHAYKLEIVLPSKQQKEFIAEAPKDFHNVN